MVSSKSPHKHQYTIIGTPGLWPPLPHHIVITADSKEELYEKLNKWRKDNEQTDDKGD
jgi:hypothetical protein